jgi:hypothetical protein
LLGSGARRCRSALPGLEQRRGRLINTPRRSREIADGDEPDVSQRICEPKPTGRHRAKRSRARTSVNGKAVRVAARQRDQRAAAGHGGRPRPLRLLHLAQRRTLQGRCPVHRAAARRSSGSPHAREIALKRGMPPIDPVPVRLAGRLHSPRVFPRSRARSARSARGPARVSWTSCQTAAGCWPSRSPLCGTPDAAAGRLHREWRSRS